MEKTCTSSKRDENENHDEVIEENSCKSSSPIFALGSTSNAKCVQSPDDYIPVSQVVRNSKRFSNFSEGQDSFLRISPVSSPPNDKTSRDVQMPVVHTLGTLVKSNPNAKVNFDKETGDVTLDDANFKTPNVFQGLGMVDKDISWVSSMETPAPHTLTLNEYNTIERATFFPQSELSNVQPRALFSPSKNDDCDCLPLTYSSNSEEDVEGCSSKTQLTDVCETLKEICMSPVQEKKEVEAVTKDSQKYKTLSQKASDVCKKEASPDSPVFTVRNKKGKSKAKKTRPFLVLSPVVCHEDDSNVEDKSVSYVSEQCNSIQDDSFQNMSFSCIDELCKNSIGGSECDSTNISKQNEKDSCVPVQKSNFGRFFYNETCEGDELRPVTSADDFFESAKAFEEVDLELERKACEFLISEEYITFNDLKCETMDVAHGLKRVRPDQTCQKSPETVQKKKMMKLDSAEERFVCNPPPSVDPTQVNQKKTNCDILSSESELNEQMLNRFELAEKSDPTPSVSNKDSFPMFATALGKPISVSDDAYRKVKLMFNECEAAVTEEERPAEDKPVTNAFQGFKTASGAAVTVSEKSLKKVQSLFRDLDVGNDGSNFTTETEAIPEKEVEDTEDAEVKRFNPIRSPIGFKTASNKAVVLSKKSLDKAKALWRGEEELDEEILPAEKKNPANNFCGFSTASGKNIDVSQSALTKARKMLRETEEALTETTGNADGAPEVKSAASTPPQEEEVSQEGSSADSKLIPSWLHTYNTSPTLTMDRMLLPAVTSHEDCREQSTPKEQYLVKSPLLGTNDRFFSHRKRRNRGRKLVFDASPKPDSGKQNFVVPFKPERKSGTVKRDVRDLNIDFAVPFKRRKVDDGYADIPAQRAENLSEEVIEGRRRARLEQAKSGKKGKVKPMKGSHLLKKSEAQMTWREAVEGAVPGAYDEEALRGLGVRDDVLRVTVFNAADYKFKSTDFFTSGACFNNTTGFPVGDDCSLIFDDNNMAGVEEFAASFFASPGVEPTLISVDWVRNHFKWIVWKFSRYERSFPHKFGGRCLTPHNVMVQLKYRYDREVDRSERPALKKILEGDESAAKRMVLYVSDVKKVSNVENESLDSSKSVGSYLLGVSDGWYSCYAQTDCAMTKLIEDGKVVVGMKLVTQGAELLNCDKGVSPLEAEKNVHLKISTNSTRRAKWDAKLGIQRLGGPILVSLSSILPNGGLIGRIDVIVVRVYPVLYMEKKSDGTHVTRNSRAEDKAAAAYQQEQEAAIEKIYQEVNDEAQRKAKEKEKPSTKLSVSNLSKITDPEELYSVYHNCSDPTSFQSLLSDEQKQILMDYQQRKKELANRELSEIVREKMKAEKMNTRKVSQLLRIRIVDLHKRDYASSVAYTAWNATEHVSRMLCEGKALSVFSATPSNSRFQKPLQLNSTRQTQYKELRGTVEYPARRVTRLEELALDFEPLFNEVDAVGVVVLKKETFYGSRLSQTIFVADADFNFAGIVFWGSCKDYGWENVLTVSSIVACTNLQCNRKRGSSGIPSVYVSDSSVFTENPKQSYLREEIKRLKASIPEDMQTFVSKCGEEIAAKLEEQKRGNVSRGMNESGQSPSLKPKYANGFKSKPNASSTPFKFVSLDSSEQEPSPIQKRIEKLQAYGEPPPLSPLLPLDNLEKFKTKFKVPLKTPDSAAK